MCDFSALIIGDFYFELTLKNNLHIIRFKNLFVRIFLIFIQIECDSKKTK